MVIAGSSNQFHAATDSFDFFACGFANAMNLNFQRHGDFTATENDNRIGRVCEPWLLRPILRG